MNPSKSISFQFLCLWLVIPSFLAAYSPYACSSRTCGSVKIPFPFGIGLNCSLNEWFSIDCNQSSSSLLAKLYLSKLNVEVTEFSVQSQTVTINTPVKSFCDHGRSVTYSWDSLNLTGSPYYFSKSDNKLMLFGCGNALLLPKNQSSSVTSVLSGCMSTCHESVRDIDIRGCYGIKCCETIIPFYLSEYQLNFTASGSKKYSGSCNFAFLAKQYWRPDDYSGPFQLRSLPSVPQALTWTIQRSELSDFSKSCHPRNSTIQLETGDVQTWTCFCSGLDKQCIENHSSFYHYKKKKNWTPVIVGITTSVGFLFLVAASFVSYKLIKRRRVKKMKEKFFKRNGGLLLQKQISSGDNVIEKTTIFTAVELEKATDNFNENRILGRGGQGTVYKGMLTDGRIVAIKRSKLVDESQVEQFINEVAVLSQVVHKNVVKLLGCCLETEVPLLVYEFIANGTLFDLIHNESDGELLTWKVRLRIASEAAGALAYLHSSVSIPIYHRDIKSTNILLDEKYTTKVSDFGTSRTVEIDKTHVTTLVKGTFGYLDPEYFQSSQFTEKSDVYSFGVVLVELLTGQKAISWAGTREEDSNLSLATRFLVSMEENCLEKIVDAQVSYHDNIDDVNAVAKLAERCLNLNGKKRPTMKEVAFELERVGISSRIHPNIPSNLQSLDCIDEEESILKFSDSFPSSSTGSSITSQSTSDTSPLLFSRV